MGHWRRKMILEKAVAYLRLFRYISVRKVFLMDTEELLKRYYAYFMDNLDDISKKYHGRFVVIKDDSVVGDYASEAEAYSEAVKKYSLGEFLIQECKSADKDSYKQTFRSRVRFC